MTPGSMRGPAEAAPCSVSLLCSALPARLLSQLAFAFLPLALLSLVLKSRSPAGFDIPPHPLPLSRQRPPCLQGRTPPRATFAPLLARHVHRSSAWRRP
eukprot:1038474-Rhodomonas_salina.1